MITQIGEKPMGDGISKKNGATVEASRLSNAMSLGAMDEIVCN